MRHLFTRTLEKAKLRRISLHDLRHTFASQLLQQVQSVAVEIESGGSAPLAIVQRSEVFRLQDDVLTAGETWKAAMVEKGWR